jgi:predicted GTPase
MVEKERSRRLGTSILNQVVQEALAFKPPPRTRGGKRGRVYYTTQVLIKLKDAIQTQYSCNFFGQPQFIRDM